MKKLKILSIILIVATLIISLCSCTKVKAAGEPYFNLMEKNNNFGVFSMMTYPEENVAIVHYLATPDANLKVNVWDSGVEAQDLTSYSLTTDEEDIATINPSTGEITIETTGVVTILKGGTELFKIHVISDVDMQKYIQTNDKVNELMDNIEIENEDKTAGLCYCFPFTEGCMMQNETLQITDMFGKNFSESFPNVTYQSMNNSLLSVDANGKITSNEERGTTDIYINFGDYVYRSFSMEVVYSWDTYLTWRGRAFGSTSNPDQTQDPTLTDTETQDQNSNSDEDDELDGEPKTGTNAVSEVLVSGIAIISLAAAIIIKRN